MGPSVIDIILLVFKIFSIIFYLLLMWFIFRKGSKEDSDSNKTFYITFIINGFVDSFDILMMTFLLDISSWGWFSDYFKFNEAFIHWSPIFSYLPIFWCEMGNLIIVINRFVALNFPIAYKIYWNWKILLLFIFLQFSIPLAVFHYLIGEKTKLNYLSLSDRYSLPMARSEVSQRNNITATIFTIIIFILTFFMSLFNVIQFRKFIKKRNEKSAILPFILYCLFVCLSMLFLAVAYTTKMIGTIVGNEYIRANAQSYVTASMLCMTIIHPYLLLFINERLRKMFFIYYSLRFSRGSVNATTSIHASRHIHNIRRI
ncbi:7TM GPCR, serpentine receptor class g (Srg) family-containing protein [Strongyloides ratti]|uniref:Serpentine receptor class gamma n=1 Tax=Strongyloides ratti TaxID=34506 RepID=A0A090MZQ6_STRRB|nr:7TM GPCR, serpentine receptor class g (Srg) family-containing protein [Strongyloides ratti]CEF69349.1 7TM GPCR, serpentine receptor class g (Srg) family-containing protein [Strongyloides ratti]